ncbi:MAG: hypothetical protein HGB04_02090 [Chlorobiaceae bacterium]|nr:hypothetical protein [Chlorobiaceae bacterium]
MIYVYLTQLLCWCWIGGLLAAPVISFLPVIGAIMGAFAAYTVWGWPWFSCAAIFFIPLILVLVIELYLRGRDRVVKSVHYFGKSG